ncbi:hypothetical protein FACS189481_4580 [Clostridia bacterium]|nr:hypothetical protein FACS189481_4580 [Clostridia bacterium]
MKCKKLRKVLCMALAAASVSSAVAPVSCAFAVENGLVGVQRDILCRLMGFVPKGTEVRNVIAIGQMTYAWSKQWAVRESLWKRPENLDKRLSDIFKMCEEKLRAFDKLMPAEQARSENRQQLAREVMDDLLKAVKIVFTSSFDSARNKNIAMIAEWRSLSISRTIPGLENLTLDLFTNSMQALEKKPLVDVEELVRSVHEQESWLLEKLRAGCLYHFVSKNYVDFLPTALENIMRVLVVLKNCVKSQR